MKTLYLTYFTSLMGMSAVALAKAYADIEITLPVIFFFGCCILVQLLAVMAIGAESAERRATK